MWSRSCQLPFLSLEAASSASKLLFRRGLRLDPKNRFAFLHQIEFIPRHGLEIRGIGFQQVYFPGLPREQEFLIVNLRLEVVDFGPPLAKLLVRRQKQTDDHEHHGDAEEDT